MGAQIPREFIVDILGRLGCKVEDGEAENVLEVTAPTFRPDLPREIDLYEEVLRLYGMDRIEPTLPGGRGRFGVRTEAQRTLDVIMRQSIIPGLMRSVAYNQSRGVHNVQLYETGVVFFGAEGHKKPKERQRLAAVMAGGMGDDAWNRKTVAFDFFDGKGVIENLIRELAIPKPRFKALSAEEAPHLQPGRAAQVLSGGTVLGWVGEIHPMAAGSYRCIRA